MECCVHSPCGRYLVRYKTDAESMRIDVVPKVSAFEPSPEVHYVAVLRESHVLEITTAAGVRKEFAGFADMTYNALIGRSPSVKFFVETCEEMKSRITAEVAQRGCRTSDSLIDDSDASQLSDTSRMQRFFTLDYDVDFTRAVFPVPLLQMATEEVNAAADSRRLPSVVSADLQLQPQRGALRHNGSKTRAEADDVNKAQLVRLQAENEKLRRENEALARLSREKMLEMQRLCEDFQQRVDGACEVERLKKKLSALRSRLRQAEAERDEAHAAFARLKQRALGGGERVKRRSRFDTPSPVPRRSSSRRLGDSPAPRGRTGGRQGGRSAADLRLRSLSRARGGGATLTKRRLWEDGGSSRCSSAFGSQCSSRKSCERLYRTPTASSRMHQRESPVHVPRRAVFR
ncbi:hypothetical protein TRSC58_00324 [Trypanosoma rangeli SC58]|uniref:Uncharacterized protein n=1 Tax=Trypanosoma rangeli SC58 TaxID=429131 RepID=A0A061JEF4_TRYRA|nr:hypothetical protein TRSC58_00324 [Trypanosoma rangeli SC58]